MSGTIGPDDRELGESDLVEWLTRHESTGLAKLNEFLAIPSISTRTEHRQDVVRCAEWLAAELRRIGLAAECQATPGHPVVVAEWRGAASAPTILIYGHYDVQPPGCMPAARRTTRGSSGSTSRPLQRASGPAERCRSTSSC